MQRGWIIALGLIGCGREDFRVSDAAYVYELNSPGWSPMTPQLRAPRAAHAVISNENVYMQPPGFLVIGGDVGTPTGTSPVELTLEIEHCKVDAAECAVVGHLVRGVERPEVARTTYDGTIMVSDGRSLQLFDPATGTTSVLEVRAQRIVETGDGIVVLGIEGQPMTAAVFKRRSTGLEQIAAPPLPDAFVATGYDRIVAIVSRDKSLQLDLNMRTWSELPPLPGNGEVTAVFGQYRWITVIVEGDSAAYRLEDNPTEWKWIPAPTDADRVVHSFPILGGGIVITDDGRSQLYSSLTDSWMTGPPAPPWAKLNAVVALDDQHIASIGGADLDFIEAGDGAD